jgi:hemerythrin-like domain-containing protein
MSPDELTPGAALTFALTREHHDIDARIEEFAVGVTEGRVQVEPLAGAMAALRRHIYLEEEFLFPPIQAAGLVMPVQVMVHEHGRIWQLMDAVEGQLETPVEPGPDAHTVLAACQALLRLLDQHNSKEEPIVYPRAEVDVTPETSTRLIEFLGSGQMPDGWVCQALARDAS